MSEDVGYIAETRDWYKDREVALQYRSYHTRGISWIRLMMFIQKRNIKKILRRLLRGDGTGEIVADFPCGTGLLAPVLNAFNVRPLALDISFAMLSLAKDDYARESFLGAACADITKAPFEDRAIEGLLTIGLLHRLPASVTVPALREMIRFTDKWIILSLSVDNLFQQCKRKVLRVVFRSYRAAPAPGLFGLITAEMEQGGFRLDQKIRTFPGLSSDMICVYVRQ